MVGQLTGANGSRKSVREAGPNPSNPGKQPRLSIDERATSPFMLRMSNVLRSDLGMRTILLFFVTAFLALATAADTYKLTLFYPSVVGESTLRPGDCKVVVDGDKVVVQQGRTKIEAKAKIETAAETFKSTTVRYRNGDGKYRVSEIRLGGTNTKLVFN